MFERFTDRARQVVTYAHAEARNLNHDYIGTEHILLGLIRARDSIAAKTLESMGISLEQVRQNVEAVIGQGQRKPPGHIPCTPRVKKVYELSLREATQNNHSYIGPEHLLLGLVREGEGVAAGVLAKLGVDLNRARSTVLSEIYRQDLVSTTWDEVLTEGQNEIHRVVCGVIGRLQIANPAGFGDTLVWAKQLQEAIDSVFATPPSTSE